MTMPIDLTRLRSNDDLPILPSIAALPKVDLHVHAEAGPRLDRIINRESAIDWRSWIDTTMASIGPGYKRLEAMARVQIDTSIENDPVLLEERIFDLMFESAVEGSIYGEFRFGAGTLENKHFLDAFRRAERRTATQFPNFAAEAVATVLVNPDRTTADRVFELCLESRTTSIVGIDIIPTPYIQEADWSCLRSWCERFANADLGITVHAGEFSEANLESAIDTPGVSRIGHAVHARNRNDLIGKVVDRNITLEMCISSNVVPGAISGYNEHPIMRFYGNGALLALGSDDPVRMRTNIGREYQLASYHGLSDAQLLDLTLRSIRSSFAPDARKRKLIEFVNAARA
jgi:adenosine deaminase